MKNIIIFDLDGTLALSKSQLDSEMSALLCDLLKKKVVAIISGGGFPQFEKQVISQLSCPQDILSKLIIFPTKGGSMYEFKDNSWKQIYSESFSEDDKVKVISALNKVTKEVNFLPETTHGKRLEDRGAEFTFSALGQEAPHEEKENWDKDYSKRKELEKRITELLPEFDVAIGGSTSIDITLKGVNKAFAINKLVSYLNCKKDEIIFAGDALFEGGNDASVITAGIDTFAVKNVEDTKNFIRSIINQ